MRYTGPDQTEETYLSRKSARAAPALMAIALALAACEAPPAMGPAPVPPPPGIDPNAPPPTPPPISPPISSPVQPAGVGRWDGLYGGRATLTVAPGGNLHCPRTIDVSDFVVQDGRITFNRYRGRVDAQGHARLTWRQSWITGQFHNGSFEGRLFQPYPSCRYQISLRRIGAP